MREALVRVESLAFGGAGFGRVDGKACFVPFTAPGELVRVAITVEKRSYLEAELVEILDPSTVRVTPPCPVFGQCGGCSWQHIAYEAQVTAKRTILADALRRSGLTEADRVGAPVMAAEPFGYRSRVQFKVRWGAGRLHIGFYRRGSHFVIDVPSGCAICHPSLNRALAQLRHVLPEFPELQRIPQLDMAVGEQGEVLLIVHYIGESPEMARSFFASVRSALPSCPLSISESWAPTVDDIARITKTCRRFRI